MGEDASSAVETAAPVVEDASPAVEDAPVVPVPTEPVLEMLAAREGVRGPGAEEPDDADSRRGVVAIAVASFVAAVIGGFEFFAMTHPGDRVAQTLCTAFTLDVMAILWVWGMDPKVVLTLVLLLPLLAMALVLWRLGDITTATLRIA